MNLQQEIAKKFAESGLFNWSKEVLILDSVIGELVVHGSACCPSDNFVGPYLTADESEEILAHIGLQVVWCGEQFKNLPPVFFIPDGYCVCLLGDNQGLFHLGLGVDQKGQRTLANNAAINWLLDNRRAELETALKELGKL